MCCVLHCILLHCIAFSCAFCCISLLHLFRKQYLAIVVYVCVIRCVLGVHSWKFLFCSWTAYKPVSKLLQLEEKQSLPPQCKIVFAAICCVVLLLFLAVFSASISFGQVFMGGMGHFQFCCVLLMQREYLGEGREIFARIHMPKINQFKALCLYTGFRWFTAR